LAYGLKKFTHSKLLFTWTEIWFAQSLLISRIEREMQ
jgi:hypothetical protein